ncbi:MAG: hypothetical protein ACSLE3_11200, partial [Microbacteriaceae bacterium]
ANTSPIAHTHNAAARLTTTTPMTTGLLSGMRSSAPETELDTLSTYFDDYTVPQSSTFVNAPSMNA